MGGIEKMMSLCMVCKSKGDKSIVEKLQDSGTMIKVEHKNNVIHTWTEYESFLNFGKETLVPTSRRINCPRCHKRGTLYGYHAKPTDIEIRYYVKHETIEGTWSKKKIKRFRRCYISEKEQRDTVLKRLGRYIKQ